MPAAPGRTPTPSLLIEEVTDYLRLRPGAPDVDRPVADGRRRRQVLLPYSRSLCARATVAAATEFANATGGSVTVLHLRTYDLVRGCRYYTESTAEAYAVADDGVEQLRRAGVDAESTIRRVPRSGLASAIVGEARDAGAGLIVIGSRRRAHLDALRPSLSRAVLRRARCPVLVVPAGRATPPRRRRRDPSAPAGPGPRPRPSPRDGC